MGENFTENESTEAIMSCMFIFASSSFDLKEISEGDKKFIVGLIYEKKWNELFHNLNWFEFLRQAHVIKFTCKSMLEHLIKLSELFPEKKCLFIK